MTPSMNIAPDGPDIETGAFSDDVGGPGARAARAGVSSPAGVGDAEGLKPSIMARYGVALRGAATRLFSLETLKLMIAAGVSFQKNEGPMLAGYIAFSTLLAVFPFLIFATSVAAATIGPSQLDALTQLLFEIAPTEVAEFIRPVLEEALGRQRTGVLTFAGLGALWVSSNGVEAYRIGFDRAYDPDKPRGFLFSRVVGLFFVVLGTAVALIMGFAVVLAPLMIGLLEDIFGRTVPLGLGILRYLLAGAAFVVFLALMHLILPSRRPGRWRRMWPGVLATVAIWTVAASLFSIYLANFQSYTVTYGGLASVIVTLLFFYLSGAVILYGAEINAALARADQARAEGEAAEEPAAEG